MLEEASSLTICYTVNNAGFVHGMDRVGSIDASDIEAMFATNVLGLVAMTQLLVKGEFLVHLGFSLHHLTMRSTRRTDFKARGTGHIINIGSIAGREPYAGGSIYCATKHAVRAFTAALMRELYETQIRVTEIQPGMSNSHKMICVNYSNVMPFPLRHG